MNDKNKRTFTIATCITVYSVILTNMNVLDTENIVLATVISIFLVMLLIVTAFIFVHSVENKVDEGDDVDE